MAHDLRAPLRPLGGFAKILREDYGDRLDDEGRGLLNQIESAAIRMDHIITDLLSLSRITRARPNPTEVDPAKLANAVVRELRASAPDRKVEVVVPPRLLVRGDGRLLQIVLENLLRNAWKFTSKVAEPVIELGVTEDRGGKAYYVRDNGVGFDQADAKRLFRPFQRLHSNADFEGTGVGLAIVERVIQRHAGRVWATAEPGRGATFWFTLAL